MHPLIQPLSIIAAAPYKLILSKKKNTGHYFVKLDKRLSLTSLSVVDDNEDLTNEMGMTEVYENDDVDHLPPTTGENGGDNDLASMTHQWKAERWPNATDGNDNEDGIEIVAIKIANGCAPPPPSNIVVDDYTNEVDEEHSDENNGDGDNEHINNENDDDDDDEGVDDMSSITLGGGSGGTLPTNGLNGVEYNNDQMVRSGGDSDKDGCTLDDNDGGGGGVFNHAKEKILKYNGGDGIIANLFVGWYFSYLYWYKFPFIPFYTMHVLLFIFDFRWNLFFF